MTEKNLQAIIEKYRQAKKLDSFQQQEICCNVLNKWGVYVSGGQYDPNDKKSAERLSKLREFIQEKYDIRMLGDILSSDLILFDSYYEADLLFQFFNKPGETYAYEYAALISPSYGLVNENT